MAAEVPPGVPARPPRPLVVHVLVDAAVAFLVMVGVALLVGAPIGPVLAVALVAGVLAAPWSRRAEARGLAARASHDGPDPGGPAGGGRAAGAGPPP